MCIRDSFQLDGRQIFRAAAGAGVILVLSSTAFVVLMSVLFNLIADLTGGIRMSVIELESTRRPVRRRRGADEVRAKARPDDDTAPADAIDAPAATSRKTRRATAEVPAVAVTSTAGPGRATATTRADAADDATAELKVLTRAGLDDRAADDAR